MAPAALSILNVTFQSDLGERAKAFGVYEHVRGTVAVGVLAGGILTQYASWRWCPPRERAPGAPGRRGREPGHAREPGHRLT